MSFAGGIFSRLYNFVSDAAANIPAQPSRFDAEFNGIATGLSNCVTRDGQSPALADLPMGGFGLTNMRAAVGVNEAVTLGQLAGVNAAALVGSAGPSTVQADIISLRSGFRGLSSYGALTPAVTASSTLALAITGAGQGGSLFVDTETLINARPSNNGVYLSGNRKLYTTPAGVGSLGQTAGRVVYNKVGRDPSLMAWGTEYLGPRFLTKLQAGSAITVAVIGDSNTALYAGPLLCNLLRTLPNTTVSNFGVSGTTFEQWRTNTGGITGTGWDMTSLLALGFDLLVDCYGGTNDAFYGGTPQTFETSKRAGYTTIRANANGGQQRLSIVQCTASPMDDGTVYGGTTSKRDELFNAEVRPILMQICDDFNTAFVDKNARVPDALVDFASLGAQDTNLDTNRVHTQPWLAASMAQWVFESIVPSTYRSNVINPSGSVIVKAVTDAPATYPYNLSIYRTGTGFPLGGFVRTTFAADGFPMQENYGFNLEEYLFQRFSSGAPAVFGKWRVIGKRRAQLTPAAGFTLPGTAENLAIVHGPDIGRLTGYLLMTTPAALTVGQTLATYTDTYAQSRDFNWAIDAYTLSGVGANPEPFKIKLDNAGNITVATATVGTTNARIYLSGTFEVI